MGVGIDGPPNDYTAGSDFDYSVWTAGTQIDLVNVNWNNDYRDVVKFASKAALNGYIDSLNPAGIRLTNTTYAKPGQDVFLPIPFNRVNRFNYLRASNPLMPIPNDLQKDFYYFILDCEYINPQTTRIRVQVDVWQTYIYDVTIGNCYVERGHVGIANSNSFANYGRDYLTVPEGLNIGSEYKVSAVRNMRVITGDFSALSSDTDRYPGSDILIVSTIDLTADPGTVEAPHLQTAQGGAVEFTYHGASMYVMSFDQFTDFMRNWADKPWVTQGIISITVIPKVTRYHPHYVYNPASPIGSLAPSDVPYTRTQDMFLDWRNHPEIVDKIPTRYRGLKKLFTFPYMLVEMTTMHGTGIVLKPESWNSPHAKIFERATMVPPGQRIEFAPRYYNSSISSEGEAESLYPGSSPELASVRGDDYGDYVDLVTQIANLPTMALVNNGAINYMASNVHGIAYQHSSADWSQSRALQGAQTAFGNTSETMRNEQRLTDIGITADMSQTGNQNRTQAAQAWVSGVGGVVSGAVGGSLFGGAGALAGAGGAAIQGVTNGINTGIGIAAADESLSIRNLAANQGLASNQRAQGSIRDSNKGYADWAARGDYANTIAGINAKVQDAQMIQPTTSGQMGGETINYVNGGLMVSLRWKLIDVANIRIVGEYWLRYGYAIRAFIRPPASLMVMSKFTYWKLSETYISSAGMPEGFKQAIRGLLEKGVTVWANPADIGNIDIADNAPIPGAYY